MSGKGPGTFPGFFMGIQEWNNQRIHARLPNPEA